MSAERIATLSCFSGTPTLTPLSGGLTNVNYLVEADNGRFVARVSEDLSILGIDRRSERLCQEAAAKAGVAPRVVHHEERILVSEFLVGKTLCSEDVRAPDMLARIAALLRELHGAWDRIEGELIYFSPFQTIRTYVATSRRIGAVLPDNIDVAVERAGEMSHEIRPFRPVLCHNDLLAANILDTSAGLRLIDWEYGGIGNPLFDVAGVCGNCELDEASQRRFVAAYAGQDVDVVLREVRILKAVSLLRESLWAVIQTVNAKIEFDYAKYAADNLAAYERASEELTCAP